MENNKGYMSVIVIIALVVIVAGYFVFYKKSVPVAQQPIPAQKDQTTDWKTYKNDKYGFEFKYPSTYLVKIFEESTVRGRLFQVILNSIAMGEGEGGYGPLANISIGVWDNSSQLSLVGWASDEYNDSFSNYGGDGFSDFKDRTLAGHKAISYSWDGLDQGKTVIIEDGKNIFLADTMASSNTDQVWQDFDGVISTLKFTK